MKKTMTLALLGILVLGLAVQAETLDQALNRITAASGNFKDFSGDMTMKMDMNMGPMSVNMNSTGKMLLLRQGDTALMRLAMDMKQKMQGQGQGQAAQDMPSKILVVVNGDVMFSEVRNSMMPQPMVMKMSVDAMQKKGGMPGGAPGMGNSMGDPAKMIAEMKKNCNLKLLGKGTVDGRPTTKIEAVYKPEFIAKMPPQAKMVMPAKMIVDIDNATGMALAVAGFDKGGKQTMTMTFSNVNVNQGLKKSQFNYTPPEGVQVMDMTKMMQQQPGAAGKK